MSKILIADDDPNIVRLLKVVLIQNGYAVAVAGNGEEAIEKIKREKPDLVLLDIMMPGKSGLHVALELKVLDDYDLPPTKFIMLTARGEKKDIEMGKKLGATAYITKPFDVENILAEIKKALS